VDLWWQSNVPGVFVIGEMAGTHGVKRPGGAALNAGQVGGLRAARYIANVCRLDAAEPAVAQAQLEQHVSECVARLNRYKQRPGPRPQEVILQIQERMTASAGHIRQIDDAQQALAQALETYKRIEQQGLSIRSAGDIVAAVQAEQLALASAAYLLAIAELLKNGGGSRGSYLVLSEAGIEVQPRIINPATGEPVRFKPENDALRNCVFRLQYDGRREDLFGCRMVPVRKVRPTHKAFEAAWEDFRAGRIYEAGR